MLRANMEKYGSPIPNDEFEDDEEEQEKKREKIRKFYDYKNKTAREKRIMFEDYYGEQIMTFKKDNARFEVYKSDNGDVQVMGIGSLTDKSQLTAVERIQAIYAKAITRQRRYAGLVFPNREDDDEDQEDEESSDYDDEKEIDEDLNNSEMIPLDLSVDSVEEVSPNETDQSDECTEIGDSKGESMKSSEEEGEEVSEDESRTLDEEDLIYQETVRQAYDSLYKYRHHFEIRRDLSV